MSDTTPDNSTPSEHLTSNATPSTTKASLTIIFVTVFIDLLGFGIVLPLLPRYGKYLEASNVTLGLLMASFSMMQFLFAPWWGKLSDRIGRRPVLIIGLLGSTCSYALFGYASSLRKGEPLMGLSALHWLFISRIGAGIAGATLSTAQAYIADCTDEKNRGKGMALIGAAFGIGFTFGPLIGAAFVSDTLDDSLSPAPGYVASVLSGLALLSAIFVLRESLTEENRATAAERSRKFSLRDLSQALTRPVVGAILICSFLCISAFALFETTLSLLTRDLHFPERDNFYIFAFVGFTMALSQGMFVRRMMPKWGEQRMGFTGLVLLILGLILTIAAAQSGSKAMLFAVLPVCVVGFSGINPSINSLLSLNSPAEEQGKMLGVGQSVSSLARIVGSFFGPWLYVGFTRNHAYMTGVGLLILATVLFSQIKSKIPATANFES